MAHQAIGCNARKAQDEHKPGDYILQSADVGCLLGWESRNSGKRRSVQSDNTRAWTEGNRTTGNRSRRRETVGESTKQSTKQCKMQGVSDSPLVCTTGLMQSSRWVLFRFVLAMSAYNMNGGSPCIFRTYLANANAMPDCTIWEVLRATMTHPSLFKEIEVGKPGQRERFVEGGLACGNPTSHLLDEAARLFPGRHVACIISIGAGHAHTIAIPRSSGVERALRLRNPVARALEAAHGIATDNERVADEMSKRFSNTRDFYYRLNVNQGMQDMHASEWERRDEVVAHTRAYMRQAESDKTLDAVVEAIRKRNAALATLDIGEVISAQ
jgi:hypothetical protein